MKGYKGDFKLSLGVLSIFAILSLFALFVVPVLSSDASSRAVGGAFNITFDTVPLYINWTNDIINVSGKVAGLELYVENSSTQITANYSQDSFYTTGPKTYPNLDSVNYAKCFDSGTNYGMKFMVQNGSGFLSNRSTLNAGESSIYNLSIWTECPPGRYYGDFNILNITNSSFTSGSCYGNVTALIDVSINKNNTLLNTTLSGVFYGRFPGNYTDYHSYFFNTSEFENASSIRINLTGFSQDLDMFLFDENGKLINASMNRGAVHEKITYLHLPYNKMWEIRIFGNVTANQDYKGALHFSRMDINESEMDFGVLEPRQDKSNVFRMNNTDTQNVTNVNEIKEVYRLQTWTNGGGGFNANNYSIRLLVPKFATQVMVRVEWASESLLSGNVSNWTLRVTDPNGNLLGTSLGHHLSANVTNATATESVTVTSVGSGREGYWNISVILANTSEEKVPNIYNITAYTWFNASEWIATNFTNSTTFSGAGLGAPANATADINVSITVPDERLINGSYHGFLRYTNGSGWEINLPLKFDVEAGLLIINQNMSNSTTVFTINENIGIDKNRFVNITYNNTGGYHIFFNYTTSSFNLTNGGSWINFTIDSWPGTTSGDGGRMIPAYSSGTLDITLNVTNVTTNDKAGTYMGWLAINTSLGPLGMNDTTSSYPYGCFNLTLNVTMNNDITINITGISADSQGGLPYEMENITANDTFMFNFSVVLANGTRVPLAYTAQITGVWINESNITSYGAYLNDTSQGKASGLCEGPSFTGSCYVNATLRPRIVGGKYIIYLNVSYDTGRVNLTGIGSYSYLFLNSTGINMSINNNGAGGTTRSIGTVDEGDYVYFNMTVNNFGNETANGKLLMGTCSYATIESYASLDLNSATDCHASKSSNYFMLDIPPQQTCWFAWKITASAIDGSNKTCTGTNLISVNATEPGFVNITGITLTVGNADASSSDSSNGDSTDGGDDSTDTYDRSISITDYESELSIALGGTGSSNITVKNTGDVSITAIIDNITIDGMETSHVPSYCNLASNGECDFEVTFNVYNTTKLGNHAGTYKVCTSGYCSDYNDEESFTVVVLSTPEREIEINESYENLSVMVSQLTNEFNSLKPTILGLVAENNLTRIEDLVNETNTLIQNAWAAIIENDYITAEEMLLEVEEKISMISFGISELQTEANINRGAQEGAIWIWVIIGVIIAGAAGFLIYMLMPPSGYHPKYGYTKQQGIFRKIKRFFKRKGKSAKIKSKMSMKNVKRVFKRPDDHARSANYAKEGVGSFYAGYKYEKPSESGFNYTGQNISQRIKRLFRRKKQHDIYEYTNAR